MSIEAAEAEDGGAGLDETIGAIVDWRGGGKPVG